MTSSRESRRPPDVICSAAILDDTIQDGGAGNDVNQDLGRPFRPLLRWKMAALPLPVAILDDLIPVSGIQDGDRKRKGCHFPPPPQWGSKRPPYTTNPETLNLGPYWWFFVLCDLQIWCMILKNNREPLLCYVKLCLSFQSHRWTKTWVTVRKLSIRVKISNFLFTVTLKFDGWPWKTIGHLFYAVSSSVHHFIAISVFKLGLQSGNAKFWSKSVISFFLSVWPSNLIDDLEKQQGTSSLLL